VRAKTSGRQRAWPHGRRRPVGWRVAPHHPRGPRQPVSHTIAANVPAVNVSSLAAIASPPLPSPPEAGMAGAGMDDRACATRRKRRAETAYGGRTAMNGSARRTRQGPRCRQRQGRWPGHALRRSVNSAGPLSIVMGTYRRRLRAVAITAIVGPNSIATYSILP
jgi:hypothetical protein